MSLNDVTFIGDYRDFAKFAVTRRELMLTTRMTTRITSYVLAMVRSHLKLDETLTVAHLFLQIVSGMVRLLDTEIQ